MLDTPEIDRTVRDAVRSTLKKIEFSDIFSEPTVDSDGQDALKITIVLSDKSLNRMSGDLTLDILVKIRNDLSTRGEFRSPIVYFMTDQELKHDVGS